MASKKGRKLVDWKGTDQGRVLLCFIHRLYGPPRKLRQKKLEQALYEYVAQQVVDAVTGFDNTSNRANCINNRGHKGYYHKNAHEHPDKHSRTKLFLPYVDSIINSGRKLKRVRELDEIVTRVVGTTTVKPVSPRKEIKSDVRDAHMKHLTKLGGRCPICSQKEIAVNGKKTDETEFDHQFSNQLSDITHTWPVCRECHLNLTRGIMPRDKASVYFNAYQARISL